jgi:outer membrane lipoprotein-sorting protein
MTEIGLENLLVKLIERGEQARQLPDVKADMRGGIKINDRRCTLLTVTQPTKRPELLFYQAKVYMDDELNVPIRYVAYDWPTPGQKDLAVIEEYNYLNLKVNVGLTDADFDPNNSQYNFY